jgi:hypothetical protein
MTLRAYVAALNDGVEEGCKGSGKECLLDSLRVSDIEVATTHKLLKTLKEGGNAPHVLELADFAIWKFRELLHKKNSEIIGIERRGEQPYAGMYG